MARRAATQATTWSARCIAAEVDGERLTDHEIHAFGFLLFVAGNETTTSLIGNASWYLAHHPDQRELLREQPDLIAGALEELLRYDVPTQCLRRTLTRDVELHGVTMREGEMVNLLFGAANRDERAFEDPDRFDVTRQPQGHLAFGHGAHFCLGAALARLEARIALGEMLERMPGWEVTDPAPARVHSGNQRGLHEPPPGRPRLTSLQPGSGRPASPTIDDSRRRPEPVAHAATGRAPERPSARSSMDRASDYGSEGWGFESLRARKKLSSFGSGLTG